MNYLIIVFLICLGIAFGYPLLPNVDENLVGLAILGGFGGAFITFFCILNASFKQMEIKDEDEEV